MFFKQNIVLNLKSCSSCCTSPWNISYWKNHRLSCIFLTSQPILGKLITREGHTFGSATEPSPSKLSGLDRMRNPRLNKGTAFTAKERKLLSIHGLLPSAVQSQELQCKVAMARLNRIKDDLEKYIFLIHLLAENERLFFYVASKYVEEIMPIVYTPIVGQGCQNFGLIYNRPRGMFINLNDKGHIYDVLKNWPKTDVRAICVTDGGRILGLGDLGAHGMGICIGKLALYTALAGIPPHQTLPVCLDVGCNTAKIREDPFYLGLKQKRPASKVYREFVDEFMRAVVKRFGHTTLIQFEDFANADAFYLLRKYKDKYVIFNDDIQGTGSVVLAGILTSLRLTKSKLENQKILFYGAGEASIGIANTLVTVMVKRGVSKEKALEKIWLIDSKGLIVKNRPEGGLTEYKQTFAHSHKPIKALIDCVKELKPTMLIGASTIPKSFNQPLLELMAKLNKRPVIFALSNPTIKSECTAKECYKYTKGNCVFASGSPFMPFKFNGKEIVPGQGNNSYVFPGVSLGIVSAGIQKVNEESFITAAMTLANLVTEEDLAKECVYPSLTRIKEVSLKIAVALVEEAYKNKTASYWPEPKDKEAFVKSQMYKTKYHVYKIQQ